MSGPRASKEDPRFTLVGPVLDSPEPIRLAEFYSELLGWPIARSEDPALGEPSEAGWALLRSPSGDRKLEFQWEPNYVEPTWPPVSGQQLMMSHLDIGVDQLGAGVQRATDLGARVADHQPQEGVVVMLDPHGHPFCLFPIDG